jgi:hypothetical protein
MVKSLSAGRVSCGSTKPRPAILDCPARIKTHIFSLLGSVSSLSIDFGKYLVLSLFSCPGELTLPKLQEINASSSISGNEYAAFLLIICFPFQLAHNVQRLLAVREFGILLFRPLFKSKITILLYRTYSSAHIAKSPC